MARTAWHLRLSVGGSQSSVRSFELYLPGFSTRMFGNDGHRAQLLCGIWFYWMIPCSCQLHAPPSFSSLSLFCNRWRGHSKLPPRDNCLPNSQHNKKYLFWVRCNAILTIYSITTLFQHVLWCTYFTPKAIECVTVLCTYHKIFWERKGHIWSGMKNGKRHPRARRYRFYLLVS